MELRFAGMTGHMVTPRSEPSLCGLRYLFCVSGIGGGARLPGWVNGGVQDQISILSRESDKTWNSEAYGLIAEVGYDSGDAGEVEILMWSCVGCQSL